MNLSSISTANLQITISTSISRTKSSVIFSQALKMRRIRSKSSDLVANVKKLMDCFRE